MTSIGTWQPDDGDVAIDETLIARLVRAASQLEAPSLGLDADEVVRFAALMRRPKATWQAAAEDLTNRELEALIRFFTVAEERLPNWEAGADSPVIPLAAVLRRRGAYPKPLTQWIKSVSRNRFLPWGSLSDRL